MEDLNSNIFSSYRINYFDVRFIVFVSFLLFPLDWDQLFVLLSEFRMGELCNIELVHEKISS